MLFQRIREFAKNLNLYNKDSNIIVALSGGADSVFLLYFFLEELKNKNIRSLEAVHVNHNLRTTAKRDEEFCKKLCDKLDIKLHIFSKNVKLFAMENKVSLEEAGRIIRYNIFEDLSKNNCHILIATAHHKDDNVETQIFNMLKGSGLKGLSGISPKFKNIIRPILCLEKVEIYAFMKDNDLPYVEDETNLDIKISRNYIRHKVVPILENFHPSFKNKMFELSEIARNLEYWLESKMNLDAETDFWGIEYIPRNKLEHNFSILYYQIKEVLDKWGLNEQRISIYKDIAQLLQRNYTGIIELKNGKSIALDTDGIRLVKEYDKFFIKLEEISSGYFFAFGNVIYYELYLDNQNYILKVRYKDFEEIVKNITQDDLPIYITTRQPGLRMKCNKKKLKEIFVKMKIPGSLKDYWPIVTNRNNEVISILFSKRWLYVQKERS